MTISENVMAHETQRHLHYRSSLEPYVMVELGHDSLPVAFQQLDFFTANNTYIGVEAWLRDAQHKKRKALSRRIETGLRPDNNVNFITIDPRSTVQHGFDGEDEICWLEGEYNPHTNLSDNIADEVFASNMFGDPHIAYSSERTRSLLGEMARLAKTGGRIVVRETITPTYGRYFKQAIYGDFALRGIIDLTPQDKSWQQYEETYNGEYGFGVGSVTPVSKGSYYKILEKL